MTSLRSVGVEEGARKQTVEGARKQTVIDRWWGHFLVKAAILLLKATCDLILN